VVPTHLQGCEAIFQQSSNRLPKDGGRSCEKPATMCSHIGVHGELCGFVLFSRRKRTEKAEDTALSLTLRAGRSLS
jgi:hypothetical protein